MLQVARELIIESGVTISLEELRLEDVIHRAGAPRSSVYRIWPYKGDFIDDLLHHMAGQDWFGAGMFNQEARDLAAEIIANRQEMLVTPQGRRALLLEAARLAVLLNLQLRAADREWRINLALAVTAGFIGDPEIRARSEILMAEADLRFSTEMTDFYRLMAQTLGLRLRAPAYRYEHLALASAALLDGLARRQLVADAMNSASPPGGGSALAEIMNAPLPGPGLDGEQADWSFAAVAFVGLVDAFLEPDPDFGAGGGPGPAVSSQP
jgi:AcrR family transcriptional regulator